MKKLIKTVLLIMAVSVLCFMASCDIFDALVYIYNARPQNGTPSAGTPENSVAATSVQPESNETIGEKGIISFQEAYEKGYLSQEDLLSIEFYNFGTAYNEELMDDNYMPKPKNPEVLDPETEEEIANALKEKTGKSHIEFTCYMGTYNNCVAVRYRDESVYLTIKGRLILTKIGEVTIVSCTPPVEKLALYKIR